MRFLLSFSVKLSTLTHSDRATDFAPSEWHLIKRWRARSVRLTTYLLGYLQANARYLAP